MSSPVSADQALESLSKEKKEEEKLEISRVSKKKSFTPVNKGHLSSPRQPSSGLNRSKSNKENPPKSPKTSFKFNSNERISVRRIGGTPYTVPRNALKPQSIYEDSKPPSVTALSPSNASSRTGLAVKPISLTGSRRSSREILLRERSKSSSSSFSGALPVNEVITKGPEIIIRYGELHKKAVVDSKWNARFFVLTNKALYYYTQAFDVPMDFYSIDIAPKGQIPLNYIENVGKDKEDPAGTKFNIYTPVRTYRLRMEGDRGGADAWVSSITGACENSKQQLHPTSSISRRESFSNLKADEVDNMNLGNTGFRDPAKKLRSEERFRVSSARNKGSGPFRPAQIEDYLNWTKFDVAGWLGREGLGNYSELFYSNSIDGKRLAEISKKSDVSDLGVGEEDVMKVLQKIEDLKALASVELMVKADN